MDAALLRAWPLAGHDRPKSGRGTCLVVGGAASTPGAVALAATAALRAGAGKVQVATTHSTAAALAVALPELLVVGLDEDREGDLVPEAAAALRLNAEQASVVLVGPGCLGETSASALLARVAALPSQAALVVDGHALPGLRDHPRPVLNRGGHALLTPNLAEAQALAGVGEDALGADVAEDLAQHYRAVVAVRGADNWIAAPDGRAWCVPGAGPGLSIPGSGDVLAGLVSGLLARTGDPAQAAVHGVHLHAEAGRRLAARVGSLGYLARELPGELPALLDALAPRGGERT